MKKLLPILFTLFFFSTVLFSQRGEHTIIYEAPPEPDFVVHQAELNHLLSVLDDWVNCKEFDSHFENLFLNKYECLEYVKFLSQPEYEEAGEEMANFFEKLSSEAKRYFIQNKGKLSNIELGGTKKKLGSPKNLEILTTFLNLFYEDGTGITIKVGLVFHDGIYQIINLDN